MKKLVNLAILPSMCLLGFQLQAAPVAVDSTFVGGVFGSYNINYSLGSAGVQLQQVTVDLQSPLFLDPTFTPPGFLFPFPFTIVSGGAETGFAGTSGISDGATSFSLLFNNFDPGESFSFLVDPDATCGDISCILAASLTTGAEFTGSTLTATFGGSNYKTTSLSGTYAQTGEWTAATQFRGDVGAVPEPGSVALLGGGLVAMGMLFRRRQGSR